MAQRSSTRYASKAGKRVAKKSKIRQDDSVRLAVKDKEALKEIMTGKANLTRYSGEEYLRKLASDSALTKWLKTNVN